MMDKMKYITMLAITVACVWITAWAVMDMYLMATAKCKYCPIKDENYKRMIKHYNDRIKKDSTHQWCIKLQ